MGTLSINPQQPYFDHNYQSNSSLTAAIYPPGALDGGTSSKLIKPSTSPVYIKTLVNNQPTQAIIDRGSAISIIHSNFLKTIQHKKFIPTSYKCQTANSTPLHLIGQIELEIKISNIKTTIVTYVATNLITTILLGNDGINSNHIHLFGGQQRLTIPDQYNRPISVSYVEPNDINYAATLINQITLPPYSQTLVDINYQLKHGEDLIFEPYDNYISKSIFMPHTLVNIKDNQTKILLINAQNHQQILSKHTRTEYFLSGNDLQKHLRAQCYSDHIRQRIIELIAHIEDPKHKSIIEDILWRNKILFDPTPSIINIPPQSAIRTGDHPPIYSKQYPVSQKDQEIKLQETQKLLERGQIEEST
ncbi:unnamed protein product, partial [Adineta steineri]